MKKISLEQTKTGFIVKSWYRIYGPVNFDAALAIVRDYHKNCTQDQSIIFISSVIGGLTKKEIKYCTMG